VLVVTLSLDGIELLTIEGVIVSIVSIAAIEGFSGTANRSFSGVFEYNSSTDRWESSGSSKMSVSGPEREMIPVILSTRSFSSKWFWGWDLSSSSPNRSIGVLSFLRERETSLGVKY